MIEIKLWCDLRCTHTPLIATARNTVGIGVPVSRMLLSARKVGWTRSRKYGWLCPDCSRMMGNRPSPVAESNFPDATT